MRKNFYLIGIKGSGMAALACILKDLDQNVTGSDISKYVFTQEHLISHDIPFFEEYDAKHLDSADYVIIGNAFDDSNIEVEACKLQNIKHFSYPQFLQLLMEHYNSCCVVGTHGKTNTTGLLSHVLDTTISAGYLIGDGTGCMQKDAKNFVLEACEYKRNFLNYHPDYAILLNIELDHVDYYQDMNDYMNAFNSFVQNVKKGIAVFGDQPETHELDYKHLKTVFYGFNEENDIYAKNVVTTSDGMEFDCYYQNTLFGHFSLPMYGKHLVANALGVIAIAILNGLSSEDIQKALLTYQGTERRFVIQEANNGVYIDDYAHHPSAISATIKAAKNKYPDRQVIAIFKPDRYSRIAYFLDRFDEAFKEADATYLCDFPDNAVREAGIDLTYEQFLAAVNGAKPLREDEKGAQELNQYQNAVFLFMSSKDIYKLKDKLIAIKEEQ